MDNNRYRLIQGIKNAVDDLRIYASDEYFINQLRDLKKDIEFFVSERGRSILKITE